jgi:hypothetical protein
MPTYPAWLTNRHFKSKDALLAAGIDCQLDCRSAMHDIRTLFAGTRRPRPCGC